MAYHRGEVLKGLTFGWVRVYGRDGEDVERLRSEMREAMEMLKCVVEGEVDWEEEVGVLVEAEPRIKALLEGGEEEA
jgi:hypothetical protein